MNKQSRKQNSWPSNPSTGPDESFFDSKNQHLDDDSIDTMAFLQEIIESAKLRAGVDSGSEHFLDDVADFLFGKMPDTTAY